MKALVLGTCSSAHIAGAGKRLGHQADHYLTGLRPGEDLDAVRRLDPGSYDCCIVVPTLRSILSQASAEGHELAFWCGEPNADELFEDCSVCLAGKLEELADSLAGATTFVIGFIEPSAAHLGALQRYDDGLDFKEFVHDLNKRLKTLTGAHDNVWFVDPNPMLDGIGRDGLQDDVFISSTHASFVSNRDFALDEQRLVPPARPSELFGPSDRPQRYGRAIWEEVERLVEVMASGQRIKLIIVDLDDTLWRGTAAEDDFPMTQRRNAWPLGLVEALLIYKRRGGLLAICSKNSRPETLRRLKHIWGYTLSLDDFASIHISWDPKSQGIARVLSDVNVLPANTLFIDDNPRELAEVKAAFPTINVCGDNHYLWRSQVLYAAETQVARITAESTARTSMVQGRVKRESSKQEMSREDWLRSLDLSLAVCRMTSTADRSFTRALELLNKTNQFNTTGKRWSETELAGLFAESGYLVTASLSDRFVDNGLVGVTVVRGNVIEQAVLSCRVFGLEAEVGMLAVACGGVLQRDDEVVAKFVKTDSNFVCRDIYRRLGFTAQESGFVAHQAPTFPAWIRLVEPVPESVARD